MAFTINKSVFLDMDINDIFNDSDDYNSSTATPTILFDNATDAGYGLDLQNTAIIPMTQGQKAFVASINAIIAIITTMVNVPVLVVWLAGSHREHTPSSAVVLNLLIFDLSVAGALYLRVGVVLSAQMASNQFACLIHFGFLIYGGLGMQVALTMAILERYIAVAYPFRYQDIVSYKVVTVVMVCTHLYAGALSFVALIPGANNWGGPRTNCTFNLVLTHAHIYSILCSLILFMAVSMSMYARVLVIARRHRRKIADATTLVSTTVDPSHSHVAQLLSSHRDRSSLTCSKASKSTCVMANAAQQAKIHKCNGGKVTSGVGETTSGTREVIFGPDWNMPRTMGESSRDLEHDTKSSRDYFSPNVEEKPAKGLGPHDIEAWTKSYSCFADASDVNRGKTPTGDRVQEKQSAGPDLTSSDLSGTGRLSRSSGGTRVRNLQPQVNESSPDLLEGTPERVKCQMCRLRLEGETQRNRLGEESVSGDSDPSALWRGSGSPFSENLCMSSEGRPFNAESGAREKRHTYLASELGLASNPCSPNSGVGFFRQHTAKVEPMTYISTDSFSSNGSGKQLERDDEQVGIKFVSSQSKRKCKGLSKAKRFHCDKSPLSKLPLSPLPLTAALLVNNTQDVCLQNKWAGLETGVGGSTTGSQSISKVWFSPQETSDVRRHTLDANPVMLNTHSESAGTKRYKLRQSGIANLLFCCCWFPYVVVQFYMLDDPRVNLMPNNVASFLCMFNAILNPFIYVLGNTRMRKNMMNCLRGKCTCDAGLLRNIW